MRETCIAFTDFFGALMNSRPAPVQAGRRERRSWMEMEREGESKGRWRERGGKSKRRWDAPDSQRNDNNKKRALRFGYVAHPTPLLPPARVKGKKKTRQTTNNSITFRSFLALLRGESLL